MKSLKLFLSILLVSAGTIFGISQSNAARHNETATFKAAGNCKMCKTRIEKALQVDGVSKAEWDVATKTVTVTFNPHVLDLQDLQQKVAAAGHDTEAAKADGKVYDKLPECCQYERK